MNKRGDGVVFPNKRSDFLEKKWNFVWFLSVLREERIDFFGFLEPEVPK